ncbi:two component transcriptional regulator, winged helix family [Paenibacillus curdlanolyticus YK9]|uniref:Two component transcriptional regulator, winged helix family n=1 Tax=Paenibacillus curdlanolyticus YK9 TaxID=717606 RepID=E0IF22_9BACL|nr:response regulator transcription factor [Paenibacillus curdlanolyticus]EFM08798.1 two component transcriptional regulator, winged helix family [Paenibacillus curdlanolyticus YK9]
MDMTILITDDEIEIAELLQLFLEKEGYQVVVAYNGTEAWELLQHRTIDLAILDINMPLMDGFALLKHIRTIHTFPVIVISARNSDYDKILGLGLGADDFIAKPFNPLEVVARVQAQLRRANEFNKPSVPEQPADTTTLGRLVLDHSSCTLLRGDEPIPLTALEYRLLKTFMLSPGKIFTKRHLFELVWSDLYLGDDNAIMVQISRLREKIEEQPKQPRYIQTVRGLGYKFQEKEH